MALRLDPAFLRKLESLRLVSRRAFAGLNRADRLSPLRGRGVEFADHRPYAPGDDFRQIDWKAYKRLNRLLLRLFHEEQDLPVHLFLDISRSMGEPAKLDYAKRVVAALCYVALAQLDHVTVYTFDTTLTSEAHPGRGPARIFRVLEQLDAIGPRGGTNLAQVFTQFAARARPRGLAIVVSDFLDPDGFERPLTRLCALGHEVCVIQVTSSRDRQCDAGGEVRLVDAETGEVRDVDVTAGLAAAYADAFERHRHSLEQFCGKYRIGYLHAEIERPFETLVLDTFRAGRLLA